MNDLISRQDAIDAMSESLKGVFIEYQDIAEKCINKLPSAEPKRVTGIWMGSVCSECGNSTSFYYDCDYCPKCGARMHG